MKMVGRNINYDKANMSYARWNMNYSKENMNYARWDMVYALVKIGYWCRNVLSLFWNTDYRLWGMVY
jgi:hypothetical protein